VQKCFTDVSGDGCS